MSNFLLALVKLQEYFKDYIIPNLVISMVSALVSDVKGEFVIDKACYQELLDIRNSLPFINLSRDIELLVYETFLKYYRIEHDLPE